MRAESFCWWEVCCYWGRHLWYATWKQPAALSVPSLIAKSAWSQSFSFHNDLSFRLFPFSRALIFFPAFTRVRKANETENMSFVNSVCLSVRPFTRNNSATTGQNSIKFKIGGWGAKIGERYVNHSQIEKKNHILYNNSNVNSRFLINPSRFEKSWWKKVLQIIERNFSHQNTFFPNSCIYDKFTR